MHAVEARDPVGHVFLVSDSTLLGLSRVFCRHCERLATLPLSDAGALSSAHRTMAGELLRVLCRDPMAFAAVWREDIAAGWFPPPDSPTAVRKALVERLTERFLGREEGTGPWFPFPSRPCRYRQGPEPDHEQGIAVHRVFLTLALAELWARHHSPSLVSLVPLALGLFLAGDSSAERFPGLNGQNGQPLLAAVGGVAVCWKLVCSLEKVWFPACLAELTGRGWPEAWNVIFSARLSEPEVRGFMETVGERRTPAMVRGLRKVGRLWEWWWQESPGAGDLFRAAGRSLAQAAHWRSHFEQILEDAKLEALADFAAGAAHEINNPLAVIGGHAQLLLREEDKPDKRRILATILGQVQRAYEMIADTRLFARPPRPTLRPVDFAEILTTLAEEFRPLAEERGITLTVVPHPHGCDLSGEADRNQILVAMGALCKNAIEAAPPGGIVTLRVEALPEKIVLSVQDNGPGIPEEHRPHIFNPFYSSRQAGRGLGMGLPKAWRIIRQHRGHIEVISARERGTIFRVVLPKSQASQSHPVTPEASR